MNTTIQHKHDLVYKIKCPQEHCLHTYTGETARRLEERILEHNRKDKISSLRKHSLKQATIQLKWKIQAFWHLILEIEKKVK